MFVTPAPAPPDIMGPYRPALAGLDQDVVRVDLDIRAWRAHATLNAADLGLDVSEEYDQTLQDYLRLGCKRLLPTRYARERDRIEREARAALRRSSYETELGFLVPKVRWPALREKLISYRAQYEHLVEAITSASVYAAICDELRAIYTQAARQAWKIRHGLSAQTAQPGADGEVIPETEDEFMAGFVARILQTIPAPEALRARFSFTWTVRYLELPSRIAEDLRQAELTRLQLQAERERLTAALEQQRLEDEVARGQKQRELEAVERRLAAEEAVAREVAEKTKADLEAKMNRTSALVEQALRTMLYDLSVDVLGSLQKNGRLPSASARRIRGVAERVRLLNYRDDAAIEALVSKLAAVAPSDGPSPAPEDIGTTLRELATVTRAELLALGATPRSGASVGIGETIDVSTYRRAREALSCETPVVTPTQGRSTRVQTPTPQETALLL
jgi:hypothetical protein